MKTAATIPGTPTLILYGEQRISSTKTNFDYMIDENKKVFQKKMEKDWLIQMLCQYSGAGKCLKRGDFIYYFDIIEMIRRGNLYLSLLPVDNWAYPDKQQKENYENITNKYKGIIKIEEDTEGYSDGVCSLNGKLSFKKLYETDELTPENVPVIELEDITAYVEFGTQSISKTVAYLNEGKILLRVPYEMEYFPTLRPVMAIFVNIQ